MSLSSEKLARATGFRWIGDSDPDGRIDLWEDYDPECLYAMGADFAKGIQGKDFDAACLVNISVDPIRQVAEAAGHWGPSFERVLLAMGSYFGGAFILGERQEGLDRLRALLNDYGYGYLYYDRSEEARGRKITDKLGYWRGTNDIAIPKLRRAVREHRLIIRSPETLRQLRKVQYAPRTSIEPDDAMDKHLAIRLAGKGSPDLVMAAAYAWHGAGECAKFEKPPPRYRPGTLGDILQHSKLTGPPPETQSWRERRRQLRRGR